MRVVRTTFQPGLTRQVSESEYTDLKRQGCVLEELDGAPRLRPATPAVNTTAETEPVAAPQRRKTTEKKLVPGEAGGDEKEN